MNSFYPVSVLCIYREKESFEIVTELKYQLEYILLTPYSCKQNQEDLKTIRCRTSC